MPYKTALVYTYDCGDFGKNLEDCLIKADYAGFPARYRDSARRGKLRGIGVSNTVEASNAGLIEHAEIRFDPTGTVTILVGTHDHGQGHQTALRQIIATKLGIGPDKVGFKYGDTDALAIGTGTFGSRSAVSCGTALVIASQKIVAKGTKIAAHLMEAAEHDIVFDGGQFTVAGTDKSVDIQELARDSFVPTKIPKGMEPGLIETGTFDGGQRTYPKRLPHQRGRNRRGDRRNRACALHRGRRRRPHDQPIAGGRSVARRHRPGRRPGPDGEHRL